MTIKYTYLLSARYDGSTYYGWAKQMHKKTIEGTINRILSKIFNQKIVISGASRTDTGVHAYDQKFIFHLSTQISLAKMQYILNHHFYDDIKLTVLRMLPNDYDLRKHISSKTYLYCIATNHDPLKTRYELQYSKPLSKEKLVTALNCFIGQKWFYNFSSLTPKDKKSPVRTIHSIEIEEKNNRFNLYFNGNGFLRHQIRIMVAVSLAYNENKITLEEIQFHLNFKLYQKIKIPKITGAGLYLIATNILI